MGKIVPTRVSWWESMFWWATTLTTLILLDDLTTGPAFWLISLISPWLATGLAFVVSFMFQVWVTRAGLTAEPGKVAQFFLRKLNLNRKNRQIEQREESLTRKVTSTVSAVLVSLIVGGVLPILLLHKSGKADVKRLHRLVWLTAGCYAVEFALIHGGFGAGALLRWLV